MVTSSNNAGSTSGSKGALAANQESGSSLAKKSSPALPLNSAKSTDFIDEDDHLIHKGDVLIGGGL